MSALLEKIFKMFSCKCKSDCNRKDIEDDEIIKDKEQYRIYMKDGLDEIFNILSLLKEHPDIKTPIISPVLETRTIALDTEP